MLPLPDGCVFSRRTLKQLTGQLPRCMLRARIAFLGDRRPDIRNSPSQV